MDTEYSTGIEPYLSGINRELNPIYLVLTGN